MFGDLKKKQEEIEQKLIDCKLSDSIENELIKVEVNAKFDVLNISFDQERFASCDAETIEDLLIELLKKMKIVADQKQAEIQASLVNDMMPGGFDMDKIKDLF